MKKHFLCLIIFFMILISSCKKNNTINNGGNWSFKNTSFTAMGCAASSGGAACYCNASIFAATSTTSNNILTIDFSSFSLPRQNEIDTVIGNPTLVGHEVEIGLTLGSNLSTGRGGIAYHSTGGNGSNQTVSVTVSPAGKISVSGTVMLVNDTLASDSSTLTFNISQTN